MCVCVILWPIGADDYSSVLNFSSFSAPQNKAHLPCNNNIVPAPGECMYSTFACMCFPRCCINYIVVIIIVDGLFFC